MYAFTRGIRALTGCSLAVGFAISVDTPSAALAGGGPPITPLPTSVANYHVRGTQPNTLTETIQTPDDCGACHGGSPNNRSDWDGSLMAQAARDPLFYAALDIAEHDAPGIGDTCLRCHAPQGWLEGRATPTDGSMLDFNDRRGVSCAVCHRQVAPFNGPGDAPVDAAIRAALGADAPNQSFDLNNLPGGIGNGGFVIDPENRIRGPFPVHIGPPGTAVPPATNCNFFHMGFLGQPAYESSLMTRAEACAACHDVSTPHFIRNSTTGDFDFSGPGVTEPNGNKYNMFPQQRTFSEWLRSEYAASGVNMNGRFGGAGQQVVHDCMDCHMPKADGFMCDLFPVSRSDIGRHFFSGAATWVLDAVARAFGPNGTFELNFDEEFNIYENIARNEKMLKCAADLDVMVDSAAPGGPKLRVRVTNQTGHKLPTGFPEGRRMWLNVEFYSDCLSNDGTPILVLGGYDPMTNALDALSTKVYEAKVGPDAALGSTVGLPAAPSFRVALSNKIYKDNRIPPRGFDNAAFAAINAPPIGASYADGQFWDDTLFPIPPGATGVRVRLFYESATREFVEYLKNNNPNAPGPENRGQFLYDLWDNNGHRPQPVLMASFPPTSAEDDGLPPCTLPPADLETLDPDGDGVYAISRRGDFNGDLQIDDADINAFVEILLNKVIDPSTLCAADFNSDETIDGADIQNFIELVVAP